MNGCVIANTPIAVDFWKVRECPQARVFLLTHLHGDHVTGLTSSWSFPIYCSEVTGKLLTLRHGIREELIHTLQVGCAEIVYLDAERQEQMTLTALDANHCPGAVMFLMEGYFGTILHTGDFRFTPDMKHSGTLAQYSGRIDQLYLDNTYCSPRCLFPSREEATRQIIDIIEAHPSHDVVLGLKKLGKENLLHELAVHFNEYISVPPQMLQTLHILEAIDVFTKAKCRIRVVPSHTVSNKMVNRLNEATPTIVILPTSLYCGIDAKPYEKQDNVFVVPYSDHCSFPELEKFVSFVKPGKIIPIVKGSSRGPFGLSIADRADMQVFHKHTRKGSNQHFEIPKSVKTYMCSTGNKQLANVGKKRKLKQPSKPVASKRTKRGVVYNSPSHSGKTEERSPFQRMNGKENIQSTNQREDHVRNVFGTSPKGVSSQNMDTKTAETMLFGKYYGIRRKGGRRIHVGIDNHLEGRFDETIGQPVYASSPLDLDGRKVTSSEKVRNWLSTFECSFDITEGASPPVVPMEQGTEKSDNAAVKNASQEDGSEHSEETDIESKAMEKECEVTEEKTEESEVKEEKTEETKCEVTEEKTEETNFVSSVFSSVTSHSFNIECKATEKGREKTEEETETKESKNKEERTGKPEKESDSTEKEKEKMEEEIKEADTEKEAFDTLSGCFVVQGSQASQGFDTELVEDKTESADMASSCSNIDAITDDSVGDLTDDDAQEVTCEIPYVQELAPKSTDSETLSDKDESSNVTGKFSDQSLKERNERSSSHKTMVTERQKIREDIEQQVIGSTQQQPDSSADLSTTDDSHSNDNFPGLEKTTSQHDSVEEKNNTHVSRIAQKKVEHRDKKLRAENKSNKKVEDCDLGVETQVCDHASKYVPNEVTVEDETSQTYTAEVLGFQPLRTATGSTDFEVSREINHLSSDSEDNEQSQSLLHCEGTAAEVISKKTDIPRTSNSNDTLRQKTRRSEIKSRIGNRSGSSSGKQVKLSKYFQRTSDDKETSKIHKVSSYFTKNSNSQSCNVTSNYFKGRHTQAGKSNSSEDPEIVEIEDSPPVNSTTEPNTRRNGVEVSQGENEDVAEYLHCRNSNVGTTCNDINRTSERKHNEKCDHSVDSLEEEEESIPVRQECFASFERKFPTSKRKTSHHKTSSDSKTSLGSVYGSVFDNFGATDQCVFAVKDRRLTGRLNLQGLYNML